VVLAAFTVSTASLTAGAARMNASLSETAASCGDAAQQTPAAGAWQRLTTQAAHAATSGDQAIRSLHGALSTAAGAYTLSDQTALDSLVG
jgi:hypothetical protein